MSITAPYNFVPLSDKIAFANALSADLDGLPSQDAPQSGGAMSGTIEVSLTAHTPFLVSKGAEKGKPKSFFLDPQGQPALPGSSWRGAVRNVLEVATFGQMRRVDNQRTSLRDLNAVADYRNNFAGGKQEEGFYSKVEAGWFQFKDGQYWLTPCSYARVDHRDTLNRLSNSAKGVFRARIDEALRIDSGNDRSKPAIAWTAPGQSPRSTDTTIAETVHRIFLEGDKASLDCTLWVEDRQEVHIHGSDPARQKKLKYREAAVENKPPLVGSATRKTGTLVFTGMPNDRKHMEFFFYDPKEPAVLDPKIFRLFRDVHEEQEKLSPTWAWRKGDFERGKAIPVFYILDGTRVRQIGLSMMFKMASENTVHDLVANTNPDHIAPQNDRQIDLAARIFGRIGDEGNGNAKDEASAFRSRVSFGWGKVMPGTFRNDDRHTVHLQKPKVGYFPSYVRQRDFASTAGNKLVSDDKAKPLAYRTYMNWPGEAAGSEEVRGWKRYPVLNRLNAPQAAVGAEASTLIPLVAGPAGKACFKAKLRYHNLHPIELGALIWAVTWGEKSNLRHAMGMGRPLGWGQIEAQATLSPAEKDALKAFVGAMEAWATKEGITGGWAGSLQMRQLTAMADPAKGDRQRDSLKQMELDPKRKDEKNRPLNGFANGKSDGMVLPEYDLDDLSPWFPAPDPGKIKGVQDMNPGQSTAIRQGLQAAKVEFEAGRKNFADASLSQAAGQEGKAMAAQTADLFPPGSRVSVDDEKKVRIVVSQDGGYRMVSRKEDGTGGPDKVKVSRLKPAP